MLIQILQVIVSLGLLNVWLVRANLSTAYRGGKATTLREEFAAYGLPNWFCTVVGALKIGSAVALLAAIWFPEIRVPVAALISCLMVGAVMMHAKVKDPIGKAMPAAAMLLMSLALSCL